MSADDGVAAPGEGPPDGGDDEAAALRWADALMAARLFAIDPSVVGGIVVRARVGPVLDAWLAHLHACLRGRPIKKVPSHVGEDRLIGGLDLASTLRAGRPVADRGLLAEADGGVVVVPMAERISATTAACLGAALDRGQMTLERDGLTRRLDTRIGVVLLDEGIDDERAPKSLIDRIAFHIDLGAHRLSTVGMPAPAEDDDPLHGWRDVPAQSSVVEALCSAALALGIDSMRATLHAVAVARMHAAWVGRDEVDAPDVAAAARLVLAPRATRLPAADEDPPPDPPPPPDGPDDDPPPADEDEAQPLDRPLEDMILEAAQAALPAGLLAQLSAAGRARQPPGAAGSAGLLVAGKQRGRPAGVRPGHPRRGGRLNVVATLRAAAPWQKLRGKRSRRVEVRQDDFRVTRFKRRTETLTIFAVDASGSAALQRLAEAKGAVEQVLADCYVRRDHVALMAFRGTDAELILPPTRSLVRAKRCLAAMAGGGTTPLATGIDAARILADDVRRRGQSPIVVVMTDGRANIARDGQPDRKRAASDALTAARQLYERDIPTLFVDTALRPRTDARALADAMGAHYLHLPYAEEQGISAWVQGASTGAAP